jgi:hypothetical protein
LKDLKYNCMKNLEFDNPSENACDITHEGLQS